METGKAVILPSLTLWRVETFPLAGLGGVLRCLRERQCSGPEERTAVTALAAPTGTPRDRFQSGSTFLAKPCTLMKSARLFHGFHTIKQLHTTRHKLSTSQGQVAGYRFNV